MHTSFKVGLFCACLGLALSGFAQTDIYTLAGNGVLSPSCNTGTGAIGDGGPATSALFNQPQGVAVDAAGNVYTADMCNYRVRKISVSTGIITTVAGNGIEGYSGDGGPATSAEIDTPQDIAVDAAGNIYIECTRYDRIRKVDASTGIITTIAGNGTVGYSGDGGPATNAEFQGLDGIAVDAAGNLYIADGGNSRIREVSASTGIVTTIAGNGTRGYSGDGGPATNAEFQSLNGIAVDAAGNLYIAQVGMSGPFSGSYVRKVSAATGIIATIAGNGTMGYSGDGGPATSAELSPEVEGITVDAVGNVYLSDTANERIREVSAGTGIITTIAGNGTQGYSGDGGPATSAELYGPHQLVFDPKSGNVYIDDFNNSRIRYFSVGDPTATTLSSSSLDAYLGATLTFTATVSSPASPTVPDGVVTFYADGSLIGSATSSDGSASITDNTLALGTHWITASYAGALNYLSSASTAITETITTIPTAINVSMPSSATSGSTAVMDFQVTAADSSVPTGTVIVSANSTTLCTVPLSAGAGSCSENTLSVGAYTVSYSYGGTATYASSSINEPFSVEAAKAPVSIAISSSEDPSVYGGSVTFTVIVTAIGGSGAVPTGVVYLANGATSLGTISLVNGSGSLTTPALPAGSNVLTATYGGDGNYF